MKNNKENKNDWKAEDDLLFKQLDEMKIPETSDSLKESFLYKISHISISESSSLNKRYLHFYIKVAAIASVFVLGWFLGSISNRNDKAMLQDVQKQLDNNNKLLVLALLQQSSASNRLQAVNVTYSLPSIDNQVIAALVNSLQNDSDPNVKIKCAEVLATHLNPDSLNTIFGGALEYQREPLVQLILINYLISVGNADSKRIVRDFINSSKADDFVRSEIQHSVNL